jgi:hypothetical protein
MGRFAEIAFVFLLVWLFFPSLARFLRVAAGLEGRRVRPAAPGTPEASEASEDNRGRGAARSGAPPPAAPPETLVRCARCGVYFPRARGLAGPASPQGSLFCSEGCRRQGAAAAPS